MAAANAPPGDGADHPRSPSGGRPKATAIKASLQTGHTPGLTLDYAALPPPRHVVEVALPDWSAERTSSEIVGNQPIVWILGYRGLENSGQKTDNLKHIHRVFQRLGYGRIVSDKMPTSNWSVLWSFVYPFVELEQEISNLRPHQRVNHWPGTGFLHKLTLVTSDFRFVPKAFRLPNQKDDFLKFAEQHPEKLFVQKNNGHRGVQVKTVSEMNVTASGTFIQEFITNPFLIDGFKFDIGVYTYITSVDPLRIYVSDS
ncbi:unnamed protein product, partial [Cyprideis torosa]